MRRALALGGTCEAPVAQLENVQVPGGHTPSAGWDTKGAWCQRRRSFLADEFTAMPADLAVPSSFPALDNTFGAILVGTFIGLVYVKNSSTQRVTMLVSDF